MTAVGRAPAGQALALRVEPVSRLDPAGFDPSRVEVLSLGYTDPPISCTKSRWWEVLRPFNANARYHAANLAAHNWDVLLVGERVFLFQTRYGGGGGHWLNPDGTRQDASAKEHRHLYTRGKRRRFPAIAMEAREGPDRETGLDGNAATARAGTASPND